MARGAAFVPLTGVSHEAGMGAGLDFAGDAQLGVQFVDPLSLAVERGTDVDHSRAGNDIQITDLQVGGQTFDAVVEQAVRHGRIEQGCDQPPVQQSGITLPVWL